MRAEERLERLKAEAVRPWTEQKISFNLLAMNIEHWTEQTTPFIFISLYLLAMIRSQHTIFFKSIPLNLLTMNQAQTAIFWSLDLLIIWPGLNRAQKVTLTNTNIVFTLEVLRRLNNNYTFFLFWKILKASSYWFLIIGPDW